MRIRAADDRKAIVAKALRSVGEIGTLPKVTVRIIDIVDDPDSSAGDLVTLIKSDPALSAKLLKVSNSAFYGLPGQVADVDRALMLLGQAAVKNIAIAASLTKAFKGRRDRQLFDPADLWRHSLAVGVGARQIARLAGSPCSPDEIFLAGLIHDLGLIVERQVFAKQLAEVCDRCSGGEGDFLHIEEQVIGATHQDFGHALATKWQFPEHLRGAVGSHHTPETLPPEGRAIAQILRCADILCSGEQLGFDLPASGQQITADLLDAVGLTADQLALVRDGLLESTEEAETVFGLG
jgi:HD-like signal output (HDOD) protein